MKKTYIGTKIVQGEPMKLGDYNIYRGWKIPKDENPNREGYKVIYPQSPDDYVSWSPKEIFEDHYREITSQEANMVCSVDVPDSRRDYSG